MKFKYWLIINESRQIDDMASKIIGGNTALLDKLKQIATRLKLADKDLLVLAAFATQHANLQEIESYVSKYIQLKKNLNNFSYAQNQLWLDKNPINWIQFTELVDAQEGEKNLIQKRQAQQFQDFDDEPIFKNKDIEIYESNSPNKCIKYGKGERFCISQPGNTMWQSYRDTQGSTFYFVFDSSFPPDHALRIVVIDVTSYGKILLTDRKNNTGTIAEFGTNDQAYLDYLKNERQVPVEKLINLPKTPEEEQENRKLGRRNYDLNWFKSLTAEEKSKYIGRGHELSNEQFDYIWNNNLDSLIKQYVSTGLKLEGYQINKVLQKSSYKTTYLHFRLIARNLSGKEFAALKQEQQEEYIANSSESESEYELNDILAQIPWDGRNINVVKLLIEKGANDFNTALSVAASAGDIEFVKYLIDEKGANDFTSAMEMAADGGHLNVVKYLIDEKGANNFNTAHTALSVAARGGHLNVVKYLIDEKGADYRYAMSSAPRGGHLNVVKYLIDEKGANDFNGAMISAAQGGHEHIVKYLIDEKGVKNFNEAMRAAALWGHQHIVDLLEKAKAEKEI